MKTTIEYKDKSILVLGLAKSGFAAARILTQLGAKVTVNDQKPIDDSPEIQELHNLNIEVIGGGHPPDILERPFDLVVKNPGIPYSNPVLQKAQEKSIPIITEVEIAYHISEAEIIGITGSNGKTTTTTLIYEILKEGQKYPLISGNIGTVACEVAAKTTKAEVLVMELSSFQLMGTRYFKPRISVLLNIFNAHLDYHGTKEEYGKAKANIFKNQTKQDYAVVNADDPFVMELANDANATIVPFSLTRKSENGAYIKNGQIIFKNEPIIDIADIVLPGRHNLENILATIAAVKLYGVSNEAIRRVLQTFTGVKHRLQYIETINGRKIFNDSKATNILATQTAIAAFSEPILLLAGGLDRGNSFDELIPSLKKVKGVIAFGQTADKILDAAREAGINLLKRVDNVEKAVIAAYDMSSEGDVILLSPACASWDQFKTFEQRGDMFVESVHKLKVD
ncbi:UDP-N-acetylmuramoylalanine--D-glutamate ligase [Schinkia azotoformans MEV2011]|uniref:UDP-N-acetylmuramoylalanine--D-glutamate ligase n=2 Tax=Schinkia azotoformans TaxID=1454 RepID=K6DS96_SCHAZ|nr:UDP-N-acetylmuramoyl-L-alanine--D-glutamate ligase [Schinkia azotoformans]EKN63661.1 UDP-N-acetylmuramoyl-L-alanyl-D-glutamate synthetase [Schinkia azotoformans LMG 9581]KEF38613.1 UDP-N-acetylmuramoylalanine--D-glutamate ligase [Schinkia azotoformans MEV2011]MEC1640860.1 UDP-N-acetylmuramoyl-L-alanine--D-glutamate ligase [Schinkia azotoformans]MEC1698072.1 UDP-N-acetylmuramoyl-L-alanine--D-glutamate ligase [Schinkia azotoformans]MEC1715394.1 UDP-N-acetylmuramoyl-L-alanine--D-glutamate liga